MSSLRLSVASRLGWWFFAIWIAVGSASGQAPSPFVMERVASMFLPNAIWVHPTVMSGGLPAGRPAFEELARLGIKTLISVDGIQPDVEGAEAAGLRYVHLPHGYDGISEERLMQIAKAVRDLPGPAYIHCHHGRHRSPAAAAAVCIALGRIAPAQGTALLRMAGTNPGFLGLIQSVERAGPISAERLDKLQVEFVACSAVPPIVDAMVAMDAIVERLKDLQERGWSGDSHIEAASDALMLKERYIELHRSESENKRESGFLDQLQHGRRSAELLEVFFRRDRSTALAEDTAHYDGLMKQLTSNCLQCHQRYRDHR